MRWIRGVRGAEPPAPFPLCRILDVPTLCGLYFWLTIKNGERTAPTTVRPFSIHQTNSMCAKKEDAVVTGVLCHSSTPMIRKNVLACNIIRIKSSASRLYQRQKEGFRPEQETCPYCGSRGCCARFASYERYVLDFLDGRPVCETVRIPRIRCGSCRRTHAILTDSLIPYRSYSLFFILRVIGEYLLHLWTVEKLCTRFGITHSMLYRWIGLFQQHKAEWLGNLADLEQTPLTFLKHLVFLPEYCAFSSGFCQRTLLSFLQSHANPANCCYQPGRHP